MNGQKLLIYELNTRVWLNTLSRRLDRPITLANVPDAVIDEIAKNGVNAVWPMGVWTRSRIGRERALRYIAEYKRALVDITEDDIIGSAYSIGKYEVAHEAGGREGLAVFREQLLRRGLKLILDYVPNHVGMDHPWVLGEHSLCVRGTPDLVEKMPDDYFITERPDGAPVITAHGRDPHFPPWNDTAQLNAFSDSLRQATIGVLRDIAIQADGVRCDMAMLMMNETFERTWGWLVGDAPSLDFWPEIIPATRQVNPDFLFIAEAYWDLEGTLQSQGFDYAYDKKLYDRLRDGSAAGLKPHLDAPVGFQRQLLRFVENHDEMRAAAEFSDGNGEQHRMAATVTLTLPGAVLLHDGQFEGRRIKLPVQIVREMDEPVDTAIRAFYDRLLAEIHEPEYQYGSWRSLPVTGEIIAYTWTYNDRVRLIIANITQYNQLGTVTLEECGGHPLVNIWTNTISAPDGDTIEVSMPPYTANIYQIDLTAPILVPLTQRVADLTKRAVRWIKGEGAHG